MISLQFTSVYTYIKNVSAEIEEKLYNLLSYQPEGYFYSPKFQNNQWDGFIRLYQPKHSRFRTGLIYRVVDFLEKNGLGYELLDFPNPSTFKENSAVYTLRPYQIRAVQDMLNYRFGIIQSPPRSGKTLMMIASVDSEKKFPAMFFCRSVDLAYQTYEKCKFFIPDIELGLISDGQIDITTKGLNIATVQSVYSAFGKKYDVAKLEYQEKPIVNKSDVQKLLKVSKLVYYDECHHSKSDTSKFVLDKCISADLKIGLSATPFSAKDSELMVENTIGPVIHSVSYSDLIKENFLLTPDIKLYKLPKCAVEGTYSSIYKAAVIENEFLELLIKKIVDRIVSKGKSVVIQTEFLNHTKRLGNLLMCDTLTGKDSSQRRQDVISKLKNKEILCLVSTLFEEGLDIPSLDYTINAAGGLSNISTLQRMRSMTASTGKIACGVVDFFHQCKYLSRHSEIRHQLYKNEPEFKLSIIDVSNKGIRDII